LKRKEERLSITKQDAAYIVLLLSVPAFLFGLRALFGRTFFWGDLLYLHHPWKSVVAEMVQRGVLPLWNPYIYLGMPLAAEMQCGAWYPGSLPFFIFDFVSGLAVFHFLHFGLTGFFSYLWLRSWGKSRPASAAGAAVFMLCGGLVSRIPFLNHVSTLSYFPAFLLLARQPYFLAAAFALAFLGGYPTMLIGEIAAAGLIHSAWIYSRQGAAFKSFEKMFRGWGVAGFLSIGLSACLFIPAVKLAAGSKRGGGMQSQEVLTWSFKFRDLAQLSAPPLIPSSDYNPSVLWWKTSYFGITGAAAGVLGLAVLGPAGGAAAGAYLAGSAVVVMGGSNPLSHLLWTHFKPLHFVRYPGNMAYLFIPMMALLVAVGLHKKKWAHWAVLVIILELSVYAFSSQPTIASDYFTDAGPLVRVLRRELGDHRYLLSPLALHWHRGAGGDTPSATRDLKHRFYGLTNAPYHLSSVGNFGEPLVPQPSYDFMDFIFSRPSLEAAARWLPWADVRILMTRDPLSANNLAYMGDSLWHLYRNPGAAERAYWFDESAGASLPKGLGGPVPNIGSAKPVTVIRSREDRFEVHWDQGLPGWVYVAEALDSDWKIVSESVVEETAPVLRAFRKFKVGADASRLGFRYDPVSWRWGVCLTVLFLLGYFLYGYNRLLEISSGHSLLRRTV
jgi:hypothetical protein